jgi:hypothetical protein
VHLDITLKPGVWIDPSKFFQQIANAGYGARKDDVRLTLTGKLTKEGDQLFLTLDDVQPGPQKFRVIQGEGRGEKEGEVFAETFRKAAELLGQTVEVVGDWHPSAEKKNKTAPSLLILRKAAPFRLPEKNSNPSK